MIPIVTSSVGKHVFISYVREDSERVDVLCKVLEAAQIPYWRDRIALGPGDAWKAVIRQAIRENSLVFLACFSDNSRAKDRSHMNEELTLAIEEFRAMPPGRTWLIPVRFDSGDVPEWDLGAGRTLSDLNYSDLFGSEHMANVARLVTTIHRLIGEKQPDAVTVLAAVEQAAGVDRTDLLKRLTKEMLPDPTRRIELDDLVSQEIQRITAVLNDANKLSTPADGSNNEFVVHLAREAHNVWTVTQPFCASLQVAARWGSPDLMVPWANGLRSLLTAANRIQGGVKGLLALRHLPGMVGVFTASLACVTGRNWASLRALVIEPTVPETYDTRAVPLVEATSLYTPFVHEWVAHTLARGTMEGKDFAEALEDFTERRIGKYFTPAAQWLHTVLRPMFTEHIADDTTYDSEFDRAEIMLSLLAQDQANVRFAADPEQWPGSRPYSYWFGRSTWRAARHRGNPVEEFSHELSTEGRLWGPLQGKLFGGEPRRAQAALEIVAQDFADSARRRE